MAAATPRCPMSVPGTLLWASDTPTGEVLTFVTGGQVEVLRGRVQAMADRHNLPRPRVLAWRGPGTQGAPEVRPPWRGTAMPPSYATVVEVESGASLTVTADRPDDLEQLRYAVRMRGWWLRHRGCG